MVIRKSAAVAVIMSIAGIASAASEPGWKLVRQDETPKIFAITTPARTNLNVGSVVLSCEDVDGRKSLQLQIYPTSPGPILPLGSMRDDTKEEPRAEIVIDGRTFPIILGFGGDYAILMDREENTLPVLSGPLVSSLERGKTMLLRVDLMREPAGQPAAFDGELEIDLMAGEGNAALVTVHQECVRK